MKKQIILVCAFAVAVLVGCRQSDRSNNMNEPSGASRSSSTNTLDMSRTNSSYQGGSVNEPSGARSGSSSGSSSSSSAPSSSSSGASGSSSGTNSSSSPSTP